MNFHSLWAPPVFTWMKTTNATFGIDRGELVQVALLQIHGGDGANLLLLRWSLIGVSSVHFFLICSKLYTNSSVISRTPQRMGNRSGLPVQICPSQCTLLLSSQFSAANHYILSLFGSDREFLQISFWDISFEHCGLWHALSVLQFCRAEHLEVVPSW